MKFVRVVPLFLQKQLGVSYPQSLDLLKKSKTINSTWGLLGRLKRKYIQKTKRDFLWLDYALSSMSSNNWAQLENLSFLHHCWKLWLHVLRFCLQFCQWQTEMFQACIPKDQCPHRHSGWRWRCGKVFMPHEGGQWVQWPTKVLGMFRVNGRSLWCPIPFHGGDLAHCWSISFKLKQQFALS